MREKAGDLAAASVVFIASAVVLTLEILATRVLAPIVGLSLETYTTIIGVVLGGIALGAWLGGKAADRWDPLKILPWALVAGGIGISICGPLLRELSPTIGDNPAGILALTIAGFLAPAAFLSAVPPLIVKLRLRSLSSTGGVVGRYSAISTAGALVGSFAAGFVLIPAFSVSALLLALGVSQISIALMIWIRNRDPLMIVGAGALIVCALGGWAASRDETCTEESVYACIKIVDADGGGRLLILDGVTNAHLARDPNRLRLYYAREMAPMIKASGFNPERSAALHIGGGGLTMARWLGARGWSDQTVLEVDPEVIEALPDYAQPDPGWEMIYGDARSSLVELDPNQFELVIGDAFSGQSVPWQLTTLEATAEVKRVMRADGVYMMNLIDGANAGFVRAQMKTLSLLFDHTALIALPEQLEGVGGGNWVAVASDRPIARPSRDDESVMIRGDRLREWVGEVEPLTDDHAPVDQLRD